LPMASLHGWYLLVSPPSRRVLKAIASGDAESWSCLAVPSHLVHFPGLPRPIGVGETVEARPPKAFSCCGWTGLGCGAGRGAGGGLPVEHPQHIFFHIAMPLRSLLFIRHVASGKGQVPVPAPFLPRHRGASGFGRMLLPIVPGNGHDGQIPRRRLRSGCFFCLKSVL
jgi:hypothetical protein